MIVELFAVNDEIHRNEFVFRARFKLGLDLYSGSILSNRQVVESQDGYSIVASCCALFANPRQVYRFIARVDRSMLESST